MSGLEARERAVLRGEIARIIYENDDGSFAVLRIRETGSREYTARGALAGLAAGQEVELEGFWEQHAEFGRQFRAESFRIILPSTPDGIKRYLSSGAIPGIGKKTAQRISLELKDKLAKEALSGADELKEIAAVTDSEAPAGDALSEAMQALKALGYSPQEAASALKGVAGKAETADEMIKLALRHMAQQG